MDVKREDHIKKVCEAINKGPFGGENHDAILYLGAREAQKIRRFPTGHPALDQATGGGYPVGRFIEIYGPESGGKTTTCLHAIAEFQKKFPNEDVALIDVEFSFDPEYAAAIGVDTEVLMVHQPENGEQALNVLRQLVGLGVKLIIVDSVAALAPLAEIEGNIGDDHIARQARMMSQTMRTICSEAGKAETTVLFTNQVRAKIGVMFGEKTTTPGGNALKFYCSIRLQIVRIGNEKDGEEKVGAKTKITVKKNKTAPPFRVANLIISFGRGFDLVAGILDAAIEKKIIKKKGSWFSYEDDRLGQGRAKCIDTLHSNKDLLDEVNAKLNGSTAVDPDTINTDSGVDDIVRIPVTEEDQVQVDDI